MSIAKYSYPADALIYRLVRNADLPSLGLAVSRVVKLADSGTSSLSELANVVLADVYLTQKVLRLANSVMFRRAAPQVTTVSRAVARVGSEQIRLLALSAVLLERMANRENAARLSPELLKALYASVLAQTVGRRIGADSEEAAICAMFRGIGRLMIAMYEGECFDAVRRLAAADHVDEADAVRRLTGSGFEQIGQRILDHWGIPETIVKTVAIWPPGGNLPREKVERLQLVSQFATDVATAVSDSDAGDRSARLAAAVSGYGGALGVDSSTLEQLLDATSESTRAVARALGIEPVVPHAQMGAGGGRTDAGGVPKGVDGAPMDAGGAQIGADDELEEALYLDMPDVDAVDHAAVRRSPEGKPRDAADRLLAGIQDMTTVLAEGDDVSSVPNIALETLYRGLGFQRAVLCLHDAHAGQFRARTPYGFMAKDRLQKFAFPAVPGTDLFWSVMLRNVDVHIRDLTTEATYAKLPGWYRAACPDARSFVLLPITLRKQPLGFFYADRPMVDPVGLSDRELALVRMLKSNTLIALRTAQDE